MAATLPNRSSLLFALACLAAAAVSTIWVVLAYQLGVGIALVLPIALALVGAVAWSPTAGICIAFLCAPIDYLAAGGGGGPSVTPSEAVLFLTALSAAPRLADSLTASRIPKPFWAYGVLLVISVAGIFVATETYVVVRIVIDWLAFGIVAVYVSQLPLRSAKAVALSLAVSGGILGLTAIGSLSGQESQAGGAVISGRAEASFAHPTGLALYLILSFPFAFAFGLRGWKQLRVPMLICAVAGLIGLIATQTRGSFIGAGIALIWMMWRWQPFRRFAAVAVLVLALAAVFNIGSVFGGKSTSVVTERLSSLSLNGEGDQRLEIWKTTPKIIAEHPFLGIGQGNFPYVSPEYGLHDIGGIALRPRPRHLPQHRGRAGAAGAGRLPLPDRHRDRHRPPGAARPRRARLSLRDRRQHRAAGADHQLADRVPSAPEPAAGDGPGRDRPALRVRTGGA